MIELLQLLLPWKLLGVFIKPLVRVILGVIAAPLFRVFLHRVVRVKDLSDELERDLTLWIRGSLLLLIATANMEGTFFKWVPIDWREEHIWLIAARLMLAIGVIEGMPDQALFAIIHPGPPKLKIDWKQPSQSLLGFLWPFTKGILCQHLNRSSPVLAILTVFFDGTAGWVCYSLAITNYLIIGLVSSRDRAIDVLQQFDHAITTKRNEILEEVAITHHPELTVEQRLDAARQGGPFLTSEPAAASDCRSPGT